MERWGDRRGRGGEREGVKKNSPLGGAEEHLA